MKLSRLISVSLDLRAGVLPYSSGSVGGVNVIKGQLKVIPPTSVWDWEAINSRRLKFLFRTDAYSLSKSVELGVFAKNTR